MSEQLMLTPEQDARADRLMDQGVTCGAQALRTVKRGNARPAGIAMETAEKTATETVKKKAAGIAKETATEIAPEITFFDDDYRLDQKIGNLRVGVKLIRKSMIDPNRIDRDETAANGDHDPYAIKREAFAAGKARIEEACQHCSYNCSDDQRAKLLRAMQNFPNSNQMLEALDDMEDTRQEEKCSKLYVVKRKAKVKV